MLSWILFQIRSKEISRVTSNRNLPYFKDIVQFMLQVHQSVNTLCTRLKQFQPSSLYRTTIVPYCTNFRFFKLRAPGSSEATIFYQQYIITCGPVEFYTSHVKWNYRLSKYPYQTEYVYDNWGAGLREVEVGFPLKTTIQWIPLNRDRFLQPKISS